VESGEALEKALQWGRRLAALPPLALRCAKMLTQAAMSADLKTGIESERHALGFLFSTDDRRKGMRAFLSKREAFFSGR
jgi:enoyl-CoA hydratase